MGQGPGQPTDRYPLHPGADQLDRVAANVDAVIAVRKRAGDVADAAGCLAQTLKGQWRSDPDAAFSSLRIVTLPGSLRQRRAGDGRPRLWYRCADETSGV